MKLITPLIAILISTTAQSIETCDDTPDIRNLKPKALCAKPKDFASAGEITAIMTILLSEDTSKKTEKDKIKK